MQREQLLSVASMSASYLKASFQSIRVTLNEVRMLLILIINLVYGILNTLRKSKYKGIISFEYPELK